MSEALKNPQVVVIAGPNGAGKSTCASLYLPFGMTYVNADEVAKGLPGYPSPLVDVQAARIVLEMMDELESRQESFAVETTLAARALAARLSRLRKAGYRFHLVFVWSPSADFSVLRVAARVVITFPRKQSGDVIPPGSATFSSSIGPWPTSGTFSTTPTSRALATSPPGRPTRSSEFTISSSGNESREG
jgi:hypothetical protein